MIDTEKIKKDFPFFANNSDIAYLDTAATSQTPQAVLGAMDDYYTKHRASVHRGLYKQAEETSKLYESTRDKVAKFIGAGRDEIIFTGSATLSANMLAYSLDKSKFLNDKKGIVIAVSEHHGSMLPMRELAQRKELSVKYISVDKNLDLDYKEAGELINQDTALVVVSLASNVSGAIYDIKKITDTAHTNGALVIVDATAAVGHISVDVKALDADFLYFSGHKMCGPTGVGVLYGKKELLEHMAPSFFGGGIVGNVTEKSITWKDKRLSQPPSTFQIQHEVRTW